MSNYLPNYEDTLDIVDHIINKYENAKYPIRGVMIQADFCYICESKNPNIYFMNEDSYAGKFAQYGWIYCDKCKDLVKLINKYHYNNTSFIKFSKCFPLDVSIITWWTYISALVFFNR